MLAKISKGRLLASKGRKFSYLRTGFDSFQGITSQVNADRPNMSIILLNEEWHPQYFLDLIKVLNKLPLI